MTPPVRPTDTIPASNDASPAPALPAPRRRIAWALALVGLPTVTGGALLVRDDDSFTAVMLLYVLLVVAIAVIGGLRPAVVAAVTAFLLANFFLTQPYYTFAMRSRERVVELVVFVVVAVVVSITVEVGARHRAAQAAHARELAETDRTRSAILAAVSHDLRTPLSSTKVAVSTLRQTGVDLSTDEREELLATIEDATDRLDRVVTNLLAMTRLQAGALPVRMQPVVLDEVVGKALISIGTHLPALDVDVSESLPTVDADPDLLERVLANLIANALRFDPVSTEVHAGRSSRGVTVTVTDHGPGVPPERWHEMFIAFRRLDDRDGHNGSGLGLAIAQGFAEAMHIPLTPSHTPGGGLTMTIDLEVACNAS